MRTLILIGLSISLLPSLGQQFKRVEGSVLPNTVGDNAGLAVADYNNDGFLDVFVSKNGNADPKRINRLLKNTGAGNFIDVTLEAGFSNAIGGMSISWGDYNNDGFPDVFLSGLSENQLYKNNGNGTFTDVTAEAGLRDFCATCLNNFSSTWWDQDYDGDLDLFVVGYYVANAQYRNNGDGTFTKTNLVNTTESYLSYTALPMDFNNDGILDLYVANDFDINNFLYLNDKTSFTEAAVAYKVEDPYDGMGLAVCDYDNNGLFDFYITNIAENGLYQHTESGFTNVASQLGVADVGWSWGVVLSDLDHDGFEDLFVVNQQHDNAHNRLYRNVATANGRGFEDISTQLGTTTDADSRSIVTFDYDNDGDLDVIISNNHTAAHFYENTLSNSAGTGFLKVLLEGTSSNKSAIGTTVRITTSSGTQSRSNVGIGFLSQSLLPVHFGLGDATQIQKVRIEWPSGIVEEFADVPINSVIKIVENTSYSIVNEPKANKIKGCTDPRSCTYNPEATEDDGTCQYLTPGTISGPSVVTPISKATYVYTPAGNQSHFSWSATNGEVAHGNGSTTIEVEWGLAPTGKIILTASDDACSTPSIEYNVQVKLPTDIKERFKDHSVARIWNEALLQAIRNDFARPTVHARNLFHTAVALYDSWAIYNGKEPYLIGNELHSYISNFSSFQTNESIETALPKTISYAAYRLLRHRFQNSPNRDKTLKSFDDLMGLLGYDISNVSLNYKNGDAAALGNFIGSELIAYGMMDHANEENGYRNLSYKPSNNPLNPRNPGNPSVGDPNKWQPLQLEIFIDQSGNIIRENVPGFLSPEWGSVYPFSLTDKDLTTYTRDGYEYKVFHDPGDPPYLDSENASTTDWYKWGFSLVSIWASHLSPDDGVMWDISPASIGKINLNDIPTNYADYENFYDLINGGDIGTGYDLNPITNQPYEPQIVPRGDYARVLAEFWADGPNSETPPGHWFSILNYVNDQPNLVRKISGQGTLMDELEWDVKTYLTLGGAMHDVAITAWGIKGWYDYARPITAIRYMGDKGQSSDPNLPSYNPMGFELVDGLIELVKAGDPLAGANNQHVGKIKLYTWKGHDYITTPETDAAGVGWILAENWWPYQRPSFITPPFAGFISGHSTFSRAAAEVLTSLTGSEYFPGGMGTFVARKNEFLVFEEGPSQDIILQWASYRDASDQCSLSRIWGGIHPPCDDLPGRIIGKKIATEVFTKALELFNTNGPLTAKKPVSINLFPNPIQVSNSIYINGIDEKTDFEVIGLNGIRVPTEVSFDPNQKTHTIHLAHDLQPGIYILRSRNHTWKIIKQ